MLARSVAGAEGQTSCIGQLQIDWLGLVMEPLRLRLDANREIRARIIEHDKLRFAFDATNAEQQRCMVVWWLSLIHI